MRERIKQLKKRSQEGFTLVELMAVLAILAILLAIAIPAIGKLIDKSDASADKSSIELIERAGEKAHVEKLPFDEPSGDMPKESYTIPTLIEEGYLDLDEDSKFNAPEHYVVKENNQNDRNPNNDGDTTTPNKSGNFVYVGIGAPGNPGGGGVVTEDPYTPVTIVPDGCTAITTDVQLDDIRNNLSGCYIMMNDIDLATSVFNTDSDGWEPIGTKASGTKFTGIFYGNGYTINGLYINDPLGDYLGLFGMTDGAEFTNLTIENVNLTGESLTAVLAGQTDNTLVDNVKTSGSVETSDWLAAGLIANGWNNTIIKNASSSVNVTGMGTVAGLVGDFRNSDIQNSHTSGSITSTASNTGGLVGYLSGGNISDSYSTGDITSTSTYTGGLGGFVQDVTIDNSYATGDVTGADETGGFIGGLYTSEWDRNTVTDIYATGSVTSSHASRVGGLMGYMDLTDLTKATSSGHVIASGEANDWNWDASGGFIGEVNASTLINTHSTGNVDGEGFVGGFIGSTYLDVSISNSSSTGSATNREAVNWDIAQSVGGFIGVVESGTLITNSFATGNVGGNLSGPDDEVAGFIGLNYGGDLEITKSYSTGTVASSPISSGFFGESLDGVVTITDSYYNSETSGQSDTGKGEPRTTAELKQQATFAGFDFTNVWEIKDSSYPTLK